MPKVIVRIVDAFTDRPFAGNPAGVVLDASELTENDMQKIAREINLSETAFIVRKKTYESDFETRFFTPITEVDLCGHATIATYFVLANEGKLPRSSTDIQIKHKTKSGILPVRIFYKGGEVDRVMMSQNRPKFRAPLVDRIELARIINISPETLISRDLPLEQAFTGLWHLMVPVKSKEVIDAIRPDFLSLAEMNKKIRVTTTHLFTFDTVDPSSTVYCRDFAPAVGVNEDPVTGTACGAMMAYLVKHKALPFSGDMVSATAEQGYSAGRPGKVLLEAIGNDPVKEIRVGGKAVTVARMEMMI